MKDIKIRHQTQDIKIREAEALAPKELSKLMKEQSEIKRLREKPSQDADGTAMSEATGEPVRAFQTYAQGGATYAVRKSYNGAKRLAQLKFDKAYSKQADFPNRGGQSASFCGNTDALQTAHVRQAFRLERQKRQQAHGREKIMQSAQGETRRTADTLFQRSTASATEKITPPTVKIRGREPKSPLFQRTADHAKRAYTQRAQAHAVRKMQQKMARESAKRTVQTTKATANGIARLAQVVAQMGRALAHAGVGLLGGAGGLIALVLIIGGAAAIIATPFGVFWSGQDTDTQSVPQAVARINSEYSAKINQIQTDHPADSVVIHRVPGSGDDLFITNWNEVVAVFAVKTAGASANADDVVTIDEKRIALLSQVFWDMNAVSYSIEAVTTEDDGTVTILHFTITSKGYADMPDVYGFSQSQRQALTEMMKPEYSQMLAELVGTYGIAGGEISLTPEEIAEILKELPKDISADRRAVLAAAYSLVGKVNYFWGGKSSAVGWDSRWGRPTKVTATGSRTTGTVRPYGLDCSGFVDWSFHNALGEVIGEGGGTNSQLDNSKKITWKDALPGDIVFYPDISHVGIFAGVDDSGNPLIIHCASSQNNVVVTGLQGFSIVARPDAYN